MHYSGKPDSIGGLRGATNTNSQGFARDTREHRRSFLGRAGLIPVLAVYSNGLRAKANPDESQRLAKFFFTSKGQNGHRQRRRNRPALLNFDKPARRPGNQGQLSLMGGVWVLLSMEPRRDGPGRPFEEFYTQTPTHLWIFDLESGSLEEICDKDRLAPFVTPALLLGQDRILVQVVRKKVGQIFSVRLDGTDAREFTRAGEGSPMA